MSWRISNDRLCAGDVKQVSLVHVLAAPKPGPAHTAAIEVVGKGALDDPARSLKASLATPDNSRVRLLVTARRAAIIVPARKTLLLGLGIRLFQVGRRRAPSKPTVNGSPYRSHIRSGSSAVGATSTASRFASAAARVLGSVVVSPSGSAGCSSAATTAAGVQIHRVLGLVGQVRGAVLHLGDLGLGVAPGNPVLVREPDSCPCACGPDAPGPQPWVSRYRSPGPSAPASPGNPRPFPHGAMLRSAALASMVEASTSRCRSPFTRPAWRSAPGPSQTPPRGLHGAGARGSVTARNGGTRSRISNSRNSRSDRESEQRHSSPRSESIPSK